MTRIFPLLLYGLSWAVFFRWHEAPLLGFAAMSAAVILTWWLLFLNTRALAALLLYAGGVFLFTRVLANGSFLYAAVATLLYGLLLFLLCAREREWRREVVGALYPTDSVHGQAPRTEGLLSEREIYGWYSASLLLGAYYLWITAALGLQFLGSIRIVVTLALIFIASFFFSLTFFALLEPFSEGRRPQKTLFSFVLGFVITQFAWVIQFSPLTYFGQGAVLLVSFAAMSDMSHYLFRKSCTRMIVLRDAGIAVTCIVLIYFITLRFIPSLTG